MSQSRDVAFTSGHTLQSCAAIILMTTLHGIAHTPYTLS